MMIIALVQWHPCAPLYNLSGSTCRHILYAFDKCTMVAILVPRIAPGLLEGRSIRHTLFSKKLDAFVLQSGFREYKRMNAGEV
jgi:hypothetical protein